MRVYSGGVSYALTGIPDEAYDNFNLINGSFEMVDTVEYDTYNGTQAPWRASSELPGWSAPEGWEQLDFELKPAGYNGITPVDGDWMLDMGESPGNHAIAQSFADAPEGQKYRISFSIANPEQGRSGDDENRVEVVFNDEVLGEAVGGYRTWQTYSFEFEAGGEDALNDLVIREIGRNDNTGSYIDDFEVIPILN